MRCLLLLALLPVAACSTGNLDFIEVHGNLADGTPVDSHILANVAVVPSLLPALGTVLASGAPLSGPEDLRGFRLEWIQTAIVDGGSYPSSPNGPAVFYVVRGLPDAGAIDTLASVVDGGTITFAIAKHKTTGTLANLVLSRDGQPIMTVTSGSFQATQPRQP